jgi:hypothetical protein
MARWNDPSLGSGAGQALLTVEGAATAWGARGDVEVMLVHPAGEVHYALGRAATADDPTLTGLLQLSGADAWQEALHLYSAVAVRVLVARQVRFPGPGVS